MRKILWGSSKKLLTIALCVVFVCAMLPVAFAADLAAPVANINTPVAQPWHNQAFAGEPAGFRPDSVPVGITLTAELGTNIFYTIAAFPVAGGAAPTQTQIDSVADPTLLSEYYEGQIMLTGNYEVNADQAVVIKAIAWESGSYSDVTTLVYFQRLWVLTDVKINSDGEPNDYTSKVPNAWTNFVLDAVIDEMTQNELATMTGGSTPGQTVNGVPHPLGNPNVTNGNINSNPNSTGWTDVRLNASATGSDLGISRLCIPTTIMSDGPAGVRNGQNATCWVVATGLATSWDRDVQRMFADGVAQEAIYFGYDFMLAPAFDIHRSPIGGRNFEYYSEDPYISGVNATAYTDALLAHHVGVSLKHYVSNDQENNRNNANSVLSERTLREINLLPFEMAVTQSDPYVIMTSYNPMNGPHTTANPWLQDQLPYDQWGYQGWFQTDWGNTWNATTMTARCAQHQSGNNYSTGNNYLNYENGSSGTAISAASKAARMLIIKRNVKDILRSVIKMPNFVGVFDGLTSAQTRSRHTSYYTDSNPNSLQKELAKINRDLTGKTFVLLRNDDVNGVPVLPLTGANKQSISLVYSNSVPNSVQGNTDYVTQGGGSGAVTWTKNSTGINATTPTINWGLQQAGYSVPNYTTESNTALNAANVAATTAGYAASTDVGIMIISRTSSEGSDVSAANFNLNANEQRVIAAMANAFHAAGKPFIVIINMGGNCNTTEIRAYADAILYMGDGGQQGGQAIADVLSGAVNPSGKTVDTWPMTYNDTVPMLAYSYYNGLGVLNPSHGNSNYIYTWANTSSALTALYDEGNLCGYRFFDTIAAIDPNFIAEEHVAFPFGYGLSYTTFEYSNLKLSSPCFSTKNDTTVTATVTVKNTGAVKGRTAVEMYIGADSFIEEGRPIRELRDYAMTKVLDPGESQDITFTIKKRDLCYFDDGKYNDNWVWNVLMNGSGVNATVVANSDPIYAALANVAPTTTLTGGIATELNAYGYTKTSLNGVDAYTTYNGFFGDNGHTTGWRVDEGTSFKVQIGGSSSTADLAAYGVEADLVYGAYATISAPDKWDTDYGAHLDYDISVGLVEGVQIIDVTAQFDNTKLAYAGSTVAAGLTLLRDEYDAATGEYRATLSWMANSATFSAIDLTKVLTVSFERNTEYVPIFKQQIKGAVVTATFYGPNYTSTSISNPPPAWTMVDNHMRWDVDGGGDGELTLADLAYIINHYYLAKEGDADWADAKLFDANGDGVVDLPDTLIILSFCK